MKNPHKLLHDPAIIANVESLRRIDERGMLYEMTVDWDYYQIPPELVPALSAGCSTLFMPNLEGEAVMYRNYDFRHYVHNDPAQGLTNVAVVVHGRNPKAKYKSVGVSDAFWLDNKEGRFITGSLDDGVTDISTLAVSPFMVMDGLNEAGLCLSIMALTVTPEWTPIDYEEGLKLAENPYKFTRRLEKSGEEPSPFDKYVPVGGVTLNTADRLAWRCSKATPAQHVPGRPDASHVTLMRLMLDGCATVEEAVALAGRFNISSVLPGADFHVLVGDRTGKAVVLEWNGDEMAVTPSQCCTNYRLSYEDGFRDRDRRYECLAAGLERFPDRMPELSGEALMALVSQSPDNGVDRGKTLFTCVYHTAQQTLKLFLDGDFSQSWSFDL